MIKKIICFLLLISVFLLNVSAAYAAPNTICQTSILIDVKTGTILYENKANQKMYPASLTKIMTAILVIEVGNLSDVITIDDDTPHEIEGSHIALEEGEILTLKDLLYALMLPSANDAALALAKHYGGSEEKFVKIMNERAKELGAYNTHFANPHGLHDPNHYTTAADLALIAKYAMENETFREIVSTERYEIPPTNKKSETRYFANLNKLIHNTSYNQIYVNGAYIDPSYEYATGIKTGYTPEAGNTLVASASKDGTDLIAVIMNGVSLEMYQDAHNLFNYGFKEFESTTLIGKNTFVQNIEVKNGDSKEISAITESDFTTLIKKDSKNKIESKVIINDINLPLKENDVVGKIEYKSDGKVIGTVNLITPTSVKSTLTENSRGNIFFTIIKYILMIIAGIVTGLFLLKIYNDIRIKLIRKKRKSRYNG
ncbi:D-alanyl-D-alanine carboxypeptidase [Sedimentibacter hydroxybenzoicus DSM 7310]|uniref:serine-type D-Ala-D-Ala carboxypeptidase n=1 Tax=Sedimentibacter hydroxybenzoicus DSM 7310 TaxID=1123245 RepID=A0A974GW27_SEDHY|nr:D-alanyl-D-alanine carboxypeptidase family protein [Sedimentibacter hydroxybenzoicus]NYB74032.1 D-alanyl-D-alanine carboxypeptidase [Sedimentibacter hydroxybenzoicus DSM 7310]